MVFLFDNSDGQSVFRDCAGWDEADRLADEQGLTVVGEFVCWVDAETLEEQNIH